MCMRYLLDVTFYAGSDSKEDVDNKLYLLETKLVLNKARIEKIFKEVNRLLDPYEENDFPISYEDGLNIDTLMKGVEKRTNGIVICLNDDFHNPGFINHFFKVEQWQ